MAIGGRLAVNGTAQVQVVDDGAGAQVEDLADGALDIGHGHALGAERIDHDGHGAGHADGVGHLNLAAMRQTRGHHVLGNPASSVGRGAVDLRAVLAAERAAAVTAHAAVGVDDDLTAGQTAVAHGAADDEAAGGVDVDAGVGGKLHALALEHGADDVGLDLGTQLLGGDLLGMLRGHHDLLHVDGLVVDVADRDLGLAVGAQVGHGAVLAHCSQLLGHALCQVDGHGHERGRLVAGVAEHHALVAGADLLVGVVARLAMLGLVALIDALGDVGALIVDGVEHATGIAVEAVLRAIVADLAQHLARKRGHVDVGLGADLAGHDDHARGCHGLAGAAHLRGVGRLAGRGDVALPGKLDLLLKDGVEHGVGDLVAHLVGMTLGDGLGREQIRRMRVGH